MAGLSELAANARLQVQRARARSPVVDIAVRTVRRFGEDDGSTLAAALTYYTFFSIFPVMLFSASLLGFVLSGNTELREDLIRSGVEAIPLVRDALSPGGLDFIESNRGGLALTAAAMALYSGSGAVVALEHALNRIHRSPEAPSWIAKRLRSVKFLAVLGVAALLSLASSAAGNIASARPGGSVTAPALAFVCGIAVSILVFAIAFKLLPSAAVTWRSVLPGAVLAAVVFEVLKVVGTAFLARGETTRNDTFGTFAAAAALLVASYLIAQITLYAAEVNAVLAERRRTRQSSLAR